MICSEAHHLIHLDAGGDLRSEERELLMQHLETCASCGSYRQRMASAMQALVSLRGADESSADSVTPRTSVWPAVRSELRRSKVKPRNSRRFNLSVAALSVCSLSLAVISIVQTMSSWNFENVHSSPTGVSIPAGFSASHAQPAQGGFPDVETPLKAPSGTGLPAPGHEDF